MGLCILDDIENIRNSRKEVYETYKKELEGIVEFQEQNENSTQNYSYFPVVFENEEQLLKVQKALSKKNIFPRRYFYPSLDTLTYIEPKQECEISRDISRRILCLPIYAELEKDVQDTIVGTIKDNL
jgi:dTDP-4-amino-4,6-dideoxygalactose transaminase